MKYCYHCGRFTTGEPMFCNFCGRSYNVKLCPRLHSNPRIAEVCSQCGSRDLTTPQPKIPIWMRLLVFLVTLVFGTGLLLLTLLFAGLFLKELFTRTEVLTDLVAIGIMLLVLWWIWMQLPLWFRKTIYRLLQRKRRDKRRSEQ